MLPGVERIRQFITTNPQEQRTELLHPVSVDALRAAWSGLRPDAALGADGGTWEAYGEGLDERLSDLQSRVHVGAYRAMLSRRVNLPELDGRERPLGIAALEDKVVWKAVVGVILTPIYEAELLGFSCGFQPGRGAHDALDALAVGIERRRVNRMLDAAGGQFWDELDRERAIELLGRWIEEGRLLRLIRNGLHAGMLEQGLWSDTGRGPACNVRFPRSHALLREDEGGEVPTGAAAGREAEEPEAAGDPAGAAARLARGPAGHGAMAGAGAGRRAQ